MNLRIQIIALLCVLLPLVAQTQDCSLDQEFQIFTGDTTHLFIDVSGLLNGSLDDANQGVCGVELHFTHSRIENLRVELIAPSGDAVTLMGPGEINSDVTDLIRWEVNFLPCNFATNPDAGISALWDNDNPWQLFTTYDGFYHPSNGCLEQLTGPANGKWEIRIIDLGMFGTGEVSYVEILFCDGTGLLCDFCNNNAGEFAVDNIILCEGDQIAIDPIFALDPTLDANSQHLYLIYQNNQFIVADALLDISFLGPGNYQIVSLAIRNDDISMGPLSAFTLSELMDYVTNQLSCAELASRPIDLTILPTSVNQQLDFILCEGETIEVQQMEFVAAIDTILYEFDNGTCIGTQLSIVDSDIQASFNANGTEIDCGGGSIVVNALMSSSSVGPVDYTWGTDGGSYVSNLGPIVELDAPGFYYLIVDDGICTDSVGFTIGSSGMNGLTLSATVDTIDCDGNPQQILLSASVSIDSFSWTGPGLLQPITQNPFVNEPGSYILEAWANDCKQVLTVEVFQHTDIPSLDIELVHRINCNFNFEQRLINSDDPADSIEVVKIPDPVPFTRVGNRYNFFEPGVYEITVIDDISGCITMGNINVGTDTISPSATLNSTYNIDCQIGNVTINPTVVPSTATGSWTGPNNFMSDQIQISVSSIGDYTFTVLDTLNGCTNDYLVTVTNSSQDNYEILGSDLDCINDTIQLCVDPIVLGNSYSWEFNNQTMSETTSCIDVDQGGIYQVVVSDDQGCSFTSSIAVLDNSVDLQINWNGPFNPIFPCTGTLSLDLSSSIIPSTTEITWSTDADGMIASGQSTLVLEVSSPGIYTIDLFDPVSQCTATQVFEVDAPSNVLIESVAQRPICASDSTGSLRINNLLNDIPPIEIYFNGVLTTETNWDNLPSGEYTIGILNGNGCYNEKVYDLFALRALRIFMNDTIFMEEGDSVFIEPNILPTNAIIDSASWTGGGGISCDSCFATFIKPSTPGYYQLGIKDERGCLGFDEVYIDFTYNNIAYIPTAFSPNGDQKNDQFIIGWSNAVQSIQSFNIFDRWGNLLYDEQAMSEDMHVGWDGRFGEAELNSGVYLYKINLVFKDGSEKLFKGAISLVR